MTNYERKAMDPSVRIQECIAEAPVMLLDISTLHEYSNHPFIVRNDAALDTLTRDIEANGLITPILVRRIVYNNDYEILSGHRRVAAFRLLGREEIAARVIDVDDPIAAHIVIYSNMLQRSKILPSEKGRALALRNEYLKSDIRYKNNKDWKICKVMSIKLLYMFCINIYSRAVKQCIYLRAYSPSFEYTASVMRSRIIWEVIAQIMQLSSEAKWLYTVIFNYWLMTKKQKSLDKDEILYVGCTKEDLVEATDMYLHEVTWTVEELERFDLVVEEKNENGDISFLPEISLKWPKNE